MIMMMIVAGRLVGRLKEAKSEREKRLKHFSSPSYSILFVVVDVWETEAKSEPKRHGLLLCWFLWSKGRRRREEEEENDP